MNLNEFQSWELTKNVKITLKDGHIIYCDTEYYIDDDPELLGISRNNKTKYYKVYTEYDELTLDEVEKIEKDI